MPTRLLTLFVVSATAWCADYAAIRDGIRRGLTETRTPSIAVAVARNGKIVWEEGFGWADRERLIPATEHTMYSLASISKPMTATAMMTLVGAGKLNLDRPANEYLAAAKLQARIGDASEATLRRIANHSSGLPLHYQFFYRDEPYTPPSSDDTILRYGNLVNPPGAVYQYSNLGYGILGYIVSRASGKSYEDYMREDVFQRLGLTRTAVGLPPQLERYQAVRYGEDGLPIPFYDFDHPGASAIYSSAHDLVRFGMFHLKEHLDDQQAILSDGAIEEMQRPTMRTGPRAGYGIGWGTLDRADGYRVVSHTGGMGGVVTILNLVPSERLAVVVLANARTPLVQRIAQQLMAASLPNWKAQPALAPEPGEFRPSPEWTGEWKGSVYTYQRDIPLAITIRSSGEIVARLGTQFKTLLNDVNWRDGQLTGSMNVTQSFDDANHRPHYLQLSLKLRDGNLNGAASFLSLPGKRAGNALTQWVELKKQ
jgi:CubicO group peptidase (beta-lactamase class C family)